MCPDPPGRWILCPSATVDGLDLGDDYDKVQRAVDAGIELHEERKPGPVVRERILTNQDKKWS
jgi:hypothetical protein